MALNNIQQIHNEIEWYFKADFLWTYISHNERAERTVFLGEKDNLTYAAVIKSIKVYINKCESLLKEAYLLACLKKNRYFTEIVDLFTSDDCKIMYIIMRDHGVDLKDFIKYIGFDYNERYPNISRYIIFNTLCGLKILHDKELSHNDIKLENIVISFSGGKDSTVTADVTIKALSDPSIVHIFGNTTLEFPTTDRKSVV